MPSATDVYITPASRKIEWYQSSAVKAEISGSSGDLYVSGSGDLYLDAEGNNIVLASAGTTFAKLNNNNAYWDFDGNAGSSYLRFIPWNGGAGTTAYTYWGDGTHNQVIYVRGTDSINTNSTTITNTWFGQYDGAGNLDTYLQAGGNSYINNKVGFGGVTSPDTDIHTANNITVQGGSIFFGNTDKVKFKRGGSNYFEMLTSGNSAAGLRSLGLLVSNTYGSTPQRGTVTFQGLADANQPTAATGYGFLYVSGTSAEKLYFKEGDGTEHDLTGGGVIGGSVSANYIPYASSADTLANFTSAYTEGNNIIMGTTPASITTDADDNTSLGGGALDKITDGDDNVAIGYYAARSGTTAKNNVTIGSEAARLNITGNYNVSVGYQANHSGTKDSNVVIGYQAAVSAGTQTGSVSIGYRAARYPQGNNNTAIGMHALLGNSSTTTATANVAVGKEALFSITDGHANTALGYQAMYDATEAEETVAIGGYAAGDITTGKWNTAVGYTALRSGTTTNRNTALGYAAMQKYTQTGDGTNTAVGMYAMLDIETGSANVAVGYKALDGATGTDNDRNVAIGSEALVASAGGSGNVGVGYKAGYSITTGHTNVAIGEEAGYNITEAIRSQFIGAAAGGSVTTAQYNTIMGYQAGHSLTVTGNNVLIGKYAGRELTKDYNTMVGIQAGQGTTTGLNNTYIGANAAKNSSTGYYNVAVGNNAGNYLSGATGRVDIGYGAGYYVSGNGNTFIGYQTGYGDGTQTLNTANYNTAVGLESMKDITSGFYNVGMGYNALANITTGDYNVVMGTQAGEATTTQNENTLVGNYAGQDLTASYNVFVGSSAGANATSVQKSVFIGRQAAGAAAATGDDNTIVGYKAAYDLTTGYSNVILGYATAENITEGHKNVILGHRAGDSITTAHSSIAIGYEALNSTTLGSENVAIGAYAGQAVVGGNSTTGGFNVFVGHTAGYQITGNVSYGGNTMVGHAAGYSATGADRSTGIGGSALYYADGAKYNTAVGRVAGAYSKGTGSTHVGDSSGYRVSGNYNVSVGYGALSGASSGTGYGTAALNVAIGRDAMTNVTSAEQSVVIGYDAGKAITTANKTVAIGYQAGESITTGADNVLIGHQAGKNTTGQYNVMLGKGAGSANTDPNGNTFIGNNAAALNTTGYHNVVVGFQGAYSNQTSHKNTIVGYNAGQNFTDGQNTMLGYEAGYNSTTATQNTFIGTSAGRNNTTGDGNVIIGNAAGPSSTSTDSNKLYINNAAGTPLIGGDFAAYQVSMNANVVIGGTTPDAKLHLVAGSSSEPVLLIENTNADNTPPGVTFYKNTASPASGDQVGSIKFDSEEATSSDRKTYWEIQSRINDPTNTTPNGQLNFYGLDGDSPGFIHQFQFINSQFSVLDSNGVGPTLSCTGTNGALLKSAGTKMRLQAKSDSTGEIHMMAKYVGIGTTSPTEGLKIGDSSTTGKYIFVERDPTDTTYDILYGKAKYPRIRFEDTQASATQDIWHLGNQLRFGTNAGSSSTCAMFVQNGQPSDGLAYGKVQMNSGVLMGIDNPLNSGRLSIVDSTRPLVLGYDGSNYVNFEVSSSGDFTIDAKDDIRLDAGGGDIVLRDDGSEYGRLSNSSQDLIINQTQNDKDIIFQVYDNSTTTEVMRIDGSESRVGIAETSPPARLSISGDGTKEEGLMMSGDDGTNYLSLYVDSANPTRYFKLQHNSTYGGIQILDSAGNRDGYFWADGSGPGIAPPNGYSGLQVLNGAGGSSANTITHIYGKTGIGTASPIQPLHVLTSANDQGILIDVSDDTHEGRLLFGDTSSNAIAYMGYNHALESMRFFTGGAEQLRLDSANSTAKFYSDISFDAGKGIVNDVATVSEWLDDMAGSSKEASITMYSKVQLIRTDSPPINWGGLSSAKLMLPAATAGREHIINWSSNQSNLSGKTFSLNPAGSDVLYKAGVSGPVGINKNTGESIHVICAEAGVWSVVSHT